jgi:Protein of unknown function (DUF1566)
MKSTLLNLFLLFLVAGINLAAVSQDVLCASAQNSPKVKWSVNQDNKNNLDFTVNNSPNINIALPSSDNGAGDSLFIGKSFGGGKVFWLDQTKKHGLVAALTDQSQKGIAWNNGEAKITGATGDAMYSGISNTGKIVVAQGTNTPYAAKVCRDFSTTYDGVVYNDWYLPSKYELDLLFRQKSLIGGFNATSGIYWSSTEAKTNPATQAWEQEFRFGSIHEDDKDQPDQVRCIRKF